jgi:hypothetical protein
MELRHWFFLIRELSLPPRREAQEVPKPEIKVLRARRMIVPSDVVVQSATLSKGKNPGERDSLNRLRDASLLFNLLGTATFPASLAPSLAPSLSSLTSS